jgi:SsrA-binding protein
MTKKTNDNSITHNRRARFEYEFLETYEAGISLTGAEVKSLRTGGATLDQSYVKPFTDGVFLLGAHIRPYGHSGDKDYNPERPRRLLLHLHEIAKLRAKVEAKGLTIVPVSMYFKKGYAKVQIALARGKAAPDKRQSIKEREMSREAARAVKRG